MNTLSILLYLGDVVYTLNILLWMSFGVVCIAACFFIISYIDNTYKDYLNQEGENFISKALSSCFKILSVTVFLLILTPEKDTVYLIAASEVGEEVIESPVTKKLATKIEKYLDSVIEVKE